MLSFLRSALRVFLLLSASAAVPAAVGDDAPKPRPKDAAEAVQEGNVQNWVEYYRRTRPPPAEVTPNPATEPVAKPPGENPPPGR